MSSSKSSSNQKIGEIAGYSTTAILAAIGIVLWACSSSKRVAKTHHQHQSMQAAGIVLFAIGVLSIFVMVIAQFVGKSAAAPIVAAATPNNLAAAAAAQQAPLPQPPLPPTTKIKWQDQVASSPPQPLEHVKTFDDRESPSTVASTPTEDREAHPPKQVPAKPRRPTYVSAFAPADAEKLEAAFSPYTGQTLPTGGPVYYSPPYNYPVVSDMVAEREQFLARPETPELVRYRRLTELQEAAASLGPCVQQDGLIVPIGTLGGGGVAT